MKYLVVVIVVALALWLLARGRRAGRAAASRAAGAASTAPQDIVQCSHCGLHLPRAEALVNASGTFCGEEHRLAGQRSR